MCKKTTFLMLLLTVNFHLVAGESFNSINADTLQGLTQEAFVSTNDFENLKVAIDRLKSNAESCADSIVDLQLGLSNLSDEERLVREKDLQRIINDYSNISSELVSISSVEGEGDRAQTLYALQSDLETLESELNALQTYVQTYLGHLTTGDKKWYFLDSGFLAGTNNSFTADAAISQYVYLVGQTFRTKIDSVITQIKIRLPMGMPLSSDRVFISPYNSTLSTNTFINATSVETNEAPVYTYNFPDFHTYALTPYVFGLRGTSTYPFGAYCCTNEYVDDFGYLCIGNLTRANPTQYAMSLQTQYDLCFDMVFQSDTNMIVSADGIELKNGANIKISGSCVTTISELNTKIAQATQNLRYAISNHVFGTTSIASNAITTDKIASNAVTSDKIVSNAVTTVKIEDNAITSSKLANNAVITDKIANGAITESKISTGAVTSSKINDGAVNSHKIAASSITTAKISDGAVSSDKLASNSVSANKIVDGAISTEKIADNAVSTTKIAGNAITSGKIADCSVTSGKIDNNAVTSEKIAIGAITSNKIANNAVTSDKIDVNAISSSNIVSNAITTDKINDNAVTASKIANNSIEQGHFSNDLRNNLITTSGGTVTGRLNVYDFYVNTSGDWVIGDSENVGNILIGNSDGVIASSEGDLKLQSSSGKIEALNFLSHSSMQTWYATVSNGSQSEFVSVPGITANAIVLLTPCQNMTTTYWVEIDTASEGFHIWLGDKQASNCRFNYCIMRK